MTAAATASMRTRKFGAKANSVTNHKFDTLINPGSQFQITNLDNDHPMLQLSNNGGIGSEAESAISNASLIDGKIFSTNWAKLVGTDLVFDDYGELVGKVKEHLICDANITIANNEVVGEEEAPKIKKEKGGEVTTLFFKKALQAANQKKGIVEGEGECGVIELPDVADMPGVSDEVNAFSEAGGAQTLVEQTETH